MHDDTMRRNTALGDVISVRRLTLALVLATTLVVGPGCVASDEAPLVASGRLEVAVGETQDYYALQIDGGAGLVRLDVADVAANQAGAFEWQAAGGERVDVYGEHNPDGSIHVVRIARSVATGEALPVLRAPVTTGAKRVLAMQVTFDGGATLASDANVRSAFAAASRDLNAASFGLLDIQYDVVGPFDIAFGSCNDAWRWADDAKRKAADSGIDVNAYAYHSMIARVDCGWAGLGAQPGNFTWLTNLDRGVIEHELGHNFGLWHASSRSCTSNGARVAMSDSCTVDEYGHPFDWMGNAYAHHEFNAQSKVRLGWIAAADVVTATTDQTVSLVPQTLNVAGTKLLRVNGADGVVYAVDFRQSSATDTYGAGDSADKGVLVQAFFTRASDAERPQLLDMAAGSTTFADAALLPGKAHRIVGTNTSISVVSVSSSGATVKVAGTSATTPTRTFKVRSSGKCLGVQNAAVNGSITVQRTCDGGADQLWRASDAGDGTVYLTNLAGDRCLDIDMGATADGTRLQQWDCWGGSNQRWRMIANSDGTTTLQSAATGKCVDLYGFETADGKALVEWTCNGGENQRFTVD
jgi:hypothetical protein